MKKFAGSLAVGFALGTLLVGASSIETHYARASEYIQLAAESSGDADALPDVQLPRADYERQMNAVMKDRAAVIHDLRAERSGATDEAVATLESSWQVVEDSWAEARVAADEEWEFARASLIAAWEDFEAAWNETFGEETEANQL